tara:strand:+ start:77 stop:796 length:720 start_codon:yes stop_codon:yes gene_type:complete
MQYLSNIKNIHIVYFLHVLSLAFLVIIKKKKNKIKPKYYDNYIKLNQLFIIYYIFNTNSISKKIVSLIYLYRLSNLISILPNISRYNYGILTTPFFNRTIAAIGELLLIKNIDSKLLPIGSVAEILSYIAMFRKNTFYTLCENGLWTIGAIMFLIINSKIKMKYKIFVYIYIFYELTEDLPMYYKQWKTKFYNKPNNISDGIKSSFNQMKKINMGSKWNECLQWSILNFTFVPLLFTLF